MWKMHSVLYLSVCVWLSVVAEGHGHQYRFDYEYNCDSGVWLKFHVVPTHFHAAFVKCKAEGAVLASPLDGKIHQAMLLLYKNSSTSPGVYTGIHATISHEDFSSIEGVPLAKMPLAFAPGEPNNFENKDNCIIMLRNGLFADVDCNSIYPYICYRKQKPDENALPLTACGTVDKEYALDARTGSCYKFHRFGRSWRRAQTVCMGEGGHLAVINSDVEKQVLVDLFNKNSANEMFTNFKDVVAIGFSDWGEHGVWYTVNGDTLEEAGYSTFAGGQPDNNKAFDGGSFCGGMFRNGQLDDLWCDTPHLAFICEKKVDSLLLDHKEQ